MKVTIYNKIVLLVILFSHTIMSYGQENNIVPNRFLFSASILAKKDIFYRKNTLENENNLYKLQSKIQPIIAVNLNSKLSNKLSLNTGLQVSTFNYSIKREFRSLDLEFDGKLQFRILTFKLPVNLQYELTDFLFIGGGIALNHQRLQSTILESSYEAISGSYDILALDSTVLRGPAYTISAQMIALLRLSKRSSIILQCDIDFGKYPQAHLIHSININGDISKSVFKGAPHLAYVAMGYSILLFKNKY